MTSFVSRAGIKLEHALEAFELDVTGLLCADFGCNVGGFTDCLLRRGAARVHAIDTGYGTLDYRLRTDDRVVVRERTNALHADPPGGGVDLVVIDLAWTPQRHAIPAALRWLREHGHLVSLVKPHYELTPEEKRVRLRAGRLDERDALEVLARTLDAMPDFGARPLAVTRSPITGAKSGRRGRGNVEFLMLADRADADAQPARPAGA
ncbi:MAG: TlyA family rRNA (cytidine-2'-O)-methyltransferase [Planctomycetes bacterium]|nr:TlyA family rRNA (cytidine-2'-O)-methyltransferase [Planctomycetota bacterium]